MPFNKPNNIPLTSTENLTTLHALLGTFHNLLIDDCPRFRTIKNPLTKQHQSIRKPSTTADTGIFSHFLHTSQHTLHTLGENIGTETLFGTNPHLARMSPLTSGVLFLSYLTRNSPRSMCYIRSLTETQSTLVTVACQTSNKTSTATTNPFYTIRSCRQDLATVEWKLNALWVEIISKNRLSTKRPSRQKIITLPRPTSD